MITTFEFAATRHSTVQWANICVIDSRGRGHCGKHLLICSSKGQFSVGGPLPKGNMCHPIDNVWIRLLVPKIIWWKEDTGGGDELAVENTREIQKRQDTEWGYEKVAAEHIGIQNYEKKARVVWTRNEYGRQETTGCNVVRVGEGSKK